MQQHNSAGRINFLALKWQQGSITESEKREFEAWYHDFDNSLEIDTDDSREAMEQRLYQLIAEKGNIRSKPVTKWARFAVAASVVLAIGVGSYFFMQTDKVKPKAQLAANDIAPGGNKAVLTLANGRKISLTDASSGGLAVQDNVKIIKTADGSLAYQDAGTQTAASPVAGYNMISTPLGGQYHLILADGTNAWLNAGSSIRYPASFNGVDRRVEITGEVYFEVAHNPRKPFRVVTSGQLIEVLGTHFNVSAYPGDPAIKTTLLEGSVSVSASDVVKIIKPGEQSALTSKGLVVSQADLEEAVAWKNGYFRFNDEKISSVMAKLSRWYDIEVVYKGPMSNEGFNGKISRFRNISQALKMLEKTKVVHFEIEGRRVIVMQ